MKTCKIENCKNNVWSNELCKNHAPMKGFKKVVHTLKNVKKSIDYRKIFDRNDFFLQVWRKRPHYSEVSKTPLGNEPLSIFFHHILPKEKFPEAEYDEDNIILLTFDEHNNVEMNIYKYEEVNKRRDKLKRKYERDKQREEERY